MTKTEEISFILGARRRYNVLKILLEGDYTAKEISELSLISYQYVLKKLQELYEHQLVTHNNAKRGRIYSITPLGSSVAKEVMIRNRAIYGSSNNGINRR